MLVNNFFLSIFADIPLMEEAMTKKRRIGLTTC
jgi:hypothetical protein